MNENGKIGNCSLKQKLDFLSDLATILLCILINVWTSFEIVFLLQRSIDNTLLYLIYGFLDIFCLMALFAMGKKTWKVFFRHSRRSRKDSS